MPLHDPVAVYNTEALFVRDALIGAGVEAFLIEDVSQVGTWVGGMIPEIHKPQVWVARADVERAKPVLDAFERRAQQLRAAGPQTSGEAIETVCEDCGRPASFPAEQQGSVQECPHCGAFMDVGDDAAADWEDGGDAAEET